MCGIVYVKRHDGLAAAKSVLRRYRAQKSRGTEGFGYVAIKDDQVVAYHRAQTEHEITQKLQEETAPEILFHHRFPTSGPNVEEMAHPLFVSHPKLTHNYYIAHNGVIRNALERKTAHEALGFFYRTELKEALKSVITNKAYTTGYSKFNDSEALAIDTAYGLETSIPIKSQGASAVVGLAVEGTKVVDRFFYRNNYNPLYLKTDKVMTSLTSGYFKGGTQIPIMDILHFTPEWKEETHPAKLWTPSIYLENTSGGTRNYGHFPYTEYDHTIPLGSAENPLITLPSPEDLRALDEQDEFERYIQDEPDMTKLAKIVKTYSEEILLEEYKVVTNSLVELEGQAERMDEVAAREGNMESIASFLARRESLRVRIEKVKAYEKLLEAEIQDREVFNKKLLAETTP